MICDRWCPFPRTKRCEYIFNFNTSISLTNLFASRVFPPFACHVKVCIELLVALELDLGNLCSCDAEIDASAAPHALKENEAAAFIELTVSFALPASAVLTSSVAKSLPPNWTLRLKNSPNQFRKENVRRSDYVGKYTP